MDRLLTGLRTLVRVLLLIGAAAAAAARADPAAWHVAAEDGGELWLLGSVHYLRADDHPLPRIVDRLYESADALVMELDLDDLDPAALQSSFLAAAMLPPDRTLEHVLGDEVYASTAARAETLGVELRLLAQFEPWLVAVTLMDLGMARMGFRPEHGLEQYLLRRAGQDDKQVLGLETLDTQIAVFDGLSLESQQALLEQTLLELESPDEMMPALVAAWRDGRLDTLADGLLQDFEQFPGLYESLVVARNRAWADALTELVRSQQARHLVVVGALHLVGENNVVELLAERGLEITQVR